MRDAIIRQAYAASASMSSVYRPPLLAYTFRHSTSLDTIVPEGLLASLRPPDREPPRLATLTPEQAAVIVAFLDRLAFRDDTRRYQEDAMQILDEWWLPNARYRIHPDPQT